MFRFIFAALAWCLLTAVASATISSVHRQVIDFTQPEQAAKLATWSNPEHFGCTKDGFGWDGDERISREGWIETEPLAIGTGWRPAQGAGVRIKLQTNYPVIVVNGPNSKSFYAPSVYVRYSADRVHWSDWQPVNSSEDPRAPGTVIHATHVGVARRARRVYDAKLWEWSRRDDVDWGSDEHGFCDWLVKQDPDYFAKERPFVGYVQFLLEKSFNGRQRLTRFEADVNWSIGGIEQAAKVDAVQPRPERSRSWNFRGVDAEARPKE